MKQLGFAPPILILVGILIVTVVAGGGYYFLKVNTPSQKVCTMDAKICPDGSSVGRAGPNCEFSPCPLSKPTPIPDEINSGISGKIYLGPSCPVVGAGMEKECKDKPYQTTVVVTGEASKEVTRFTSDSEGNFKVLLAPGNYQLTSAENVQLPFLKPVSVQVKESGFTQLNLFFDSGIR